MAGTALSGARRKPTALRIMNGARPDRLPKDEPRLPVAVPRPPEHLAEDERRNWTRFARDLATMRVCAEVDWAAFELLVTTFTEVQRLTAVCRSGGYTYEFKRQDGVRNVRARPEAQLLNGARAQLRALLALFGLSPGDRSRVKDLGTGAARPAGGDDEFGGAS